MLRSILAAIWLASLAFPIVASGQDFPPPEEAFQVQAQLEGEDGIRQQWTIAPAYYLYREQLAVSAAAGSEVSLGELQLPAGATITDPYFGELDWWAP